MTKGNNIQRELLRLGSVLDTCGTDPKRWPVSERHKLEVLVGKNSDAGQLLKEARALARVMDAAPVSKASAALKSRIVAAAIKEGGRDVRIVPIEVERTGRVRPIYARRARALWPAAALAASFAFGLYLGVAGIGGNAVDGAFDIAMSGVSGSDADNISWLEGGAAVNEDGPL